MNTDTIRDALPANTEWQDSVMNDGTHRLLGKTANLNVEIIPDTSVRLAFAEVDQSVLSVVEQVAGDQEEALSFLHTAAQYVDYANGSMSLTQILTADHHAANVLHITNANE
jgi:hypothetical protein